MKCLCKKIICMILVCCLSFFIITPTVIKTRAAELDPNTYKPGQGSQIDEGFMKKNVTTIRSFFLMIGIVVSVIAVSYLGIKYITVGSLAEKADYKKDMIPMVVGMVILAMLSYIISAIAKIAESI